MKLIARETIRYGGDGEIAQPGSTFELDEKKYPESIVQLLESGAAEKAGPKAKD